MVTVVEGKELGLISGRPTGLLSPYTSYQCAPVATSQLVKSEEPSRKSNAVDYIPENQPPPVKIGSAQPLG